MEDFQYRGTPTLGTVYTEDSLGDPYIRDSLYGEIPI